MKELKKWNCYKMEEGFDSKFLDYLNFKNYKKLASLLQSCTYGFEESSSYGSGYNMYKTGIIIYCDITMFEEMEKLSGEAESIIIEAFNIYFPAEQFNYDLCWVECKIDPSKPIPSNGFSIDTKSIKKMDYIFIDEQISKIDKKIRENDFDGAITNARTLVEAICKHILELENIEYNKNEDLPSLYKKIASLLKMNPADYEEKYFKKILSGFFSIIQGVSEIRNKFSDSHAPNMKSHYKIEERHARLTVDATKSICSYLYLSYENFSKTKNIYNSRKE